MPNITISDLPDVVVPIDAPATFLEVSVLEAGVEVSRRIAADDLSSAFGLDATFVTQSANAILPNERILTAGADIGIVDSGPGLAITISVTNHPSQNPFNSPLGILADINTATPPTNEAVTALLEIRDLQNVNVLARLGFAAGVPSLELRSFMEGEDVFIRGTASTGNEENILHYDMNARDLELFRSDSVVFSTNTGGQFAAVSSTSNNPTTGGSQSTRIDLTNSLLALVGSFGGVGSTVIDVHSYIHGGHVTISGEDTASGATRIGFEMDPDGVTTFRYGDLASVDGGVEFSAPDVDTPFRITPLNAGVPVADFIDYNIDRDDWEIRGDVQFTDNPATSRTVTFDNDVIINGADRFIQAPLNIGNASNHGSVGSGDIYFVSDTGANRGLFLGRQFFAQNLTDKGAPQFGAVFDTDTSMLTDPGLYNLRFNNATPASVTEISIDDTGIGGHDFGSFWGAELVSGDKLFIKQVDDDTRWIIFTLSGPPVDQTGFWTMPVTVDSSGVLPVDTEEINVAVYLESLGFSGEAAFDQFNYQFDTATAQADPGPGLIRLNNATPSLATFAYVDDLDVNGIDVGSLVIDSLLAGEKFRIRNSTTLVSQLNYRLTGIAVDFTGFWRIPIVYEDGDDVLPANGEDIQVFYDPDLFIEAGTDVANQSDMLYWESDHWAASSPGMTFNNASPAIGGRLRMAGNATSDPLRCQIFAVVGNSTSGLWFTQGHQADEGFFALHVGSAGAETFTWGWDTPGGGTQPIMHMDEQVRLVIESGAGFFMEEKAADHGNIAGHGEFWVRNTGAGDPMFTDDAGTDFVLNSTAPAAPIVLLDNEQIQFGSSTDVTMDWDGVDFEVESLAASQIFNWRDGGRHRFYDPTDAQYIEIEPVSATVFNINMSNSSAGCIFNGANFWRFLDGSLQCEGLSIDGAIASALTMEVSGIERASWSCSDTLLVLSLIQSSGDRYVIRNGINDMVGFEETGGLTVFEDGAADTDFVNLKHTGVNGQLNSNLGSLQMLTAGTIRMFFTDPTVTGRTTAADIQDNGSVFHEVGYNDLQIFNDNVSDTLESRHAGQIAFKDATTARTLTLASNVDLDFPVETMTTVINAFTSGDYTITEGASTTLFYLDGSTRIDTAGGATVGPGGVANIWRESATVYYIWGTGITP